MLCRVHLIRPARAAFPAAIGAREGRGLDRGGGGEELRTAGRRGGVTRDPVPEPADRQPNGVRRYRTARSGGSWSAASRPHGEPSRV